MLWVALVVSVVVHVVGLGFVGAWLEPGPEPEARRVPVIAEPPGGIRAIELAAPPEVPEMPAAPEEPEAPDVTPEPEEEAAPAVAQTEPARTTPADSVSAADRLAPRVVDPRLWEPMVLIPREPTLAEVEARVAAAVELLSDSALAEAEAAIRARDWTVEDADGGRWGISPGKIHLGKLTLPLPIWLPVDPEASLAERRWYELDHQLERARILESFEARVKAIRERRDRERAERMEAENGGG